MSPQTRRSFAIGAAFVLAASALTAAPVAAQEESSLIYAIDGEISYLNNANSDVPSAEAVQWLYNGLFTYDQTLTPVPDLAAGPWQISEDGLTWTIQLKDNAYFQPTGENLTAQDVVFTYQLANSANCRFNPDTCLGFVVVTPEGATEPVKVLQDVKAIDDYTVEFTLADKYAPFATTASTLQINSKKTVEEAFAAFQAQTADVNAADVDALLGKIAAERDAVAAELEANPDSTAVADLAQFQAEAEALMTAADLPLPDQANYAAEDGSLDATAYVEALEAELANLSLVLSSTEIDQIAAAYPLLSISRQPVGTGPFYVTEFRPGQDITAARNEKYHWGASAFDKLYMPIIKDDVAASAALAGGDIDWKYSLTPDGYAQIEGDPALKFARYPDFGYFALMFNLREGKLFAEKSVRQALASCIDKEATVEAATGGQGVPIYADIPPASWAYNPDIPKYEYSVEKGNAMLDEAGWVDSNGDGIREKDGRPLQTKILVRAGKPDRIKFMQLLADQAKDCGFDIAIEEADFGTVLLPGLEWPLIMGGQTEQWEAYFGGWSTSYDPDPYSLWHSSNCITAEVPDTYNYICFQNERADELIEAGLKELDQAKRAEIYKEFEAIMAEELPYLWAWSDQAKEGLSVAVNGEGEWTEADMGTPTWFWELEKVNKGSGTVAE
jgi:ABC-type transport system substrate-binding protein